MPKQATAKWLSAICAIAALVYLPPASAQFQAFPPSWNNPPETEIPSVEHHTYVSTVLKADVGYNIYLPDGYEGTDDRYPVLYYLHGAGPGGNESSSATAPLAALVEAAIDDRLIPPLIVIFLNGGAVTFYADSPDGQYMVETSIITELIPYVDATYRTKASRSNRAITGMSMGGFGALVLAIKHTDLFGSVVAYAPALVELSPGPDGALMTTQRGATREVPTPVRVKVASIMFGGDLEIFDQHSPWSLMPLHAEELRERLPIRIVVGDEDRFSYHSNLEYSELLDRLNYDHDLAVVPGVAHEVARLFDAAGRESLTFHARSGEWVE